MTSAHDVSGLRRDRPVTTEVPQPRRRIGTRVVLPLVLIAAFAGVLLFAARDVLVPRTDVRVVPVVAHDDVGGGAAPAGEIVAQAAGWVEPDPFPIYVTALADGVVDEVLVLEGERVTKDQVLARLVATDAELALRRAASNLDEAEAAIAIAEANAEAAQREWDNPVARERLVRETAAEVVRVTSDQAELESAIAAAAAAEERLRDDLERAEREHAGGATGGFDVSQTRLRLASATAEHAAAVARRAVLTAELDGARARHDAARRDLELRIEETRALASAKGMVREAVARRDNAAAARDEAKLRLARMVVRAPADGAVLARLVSPGAKLMLAMDSPHSSHVIHLYDPQKLQVRVDVPLADAAAVGVDQRAEVVVEVLPDRVFSGMVTRIVREADLQKNTLQVKVAIEDPIDELKPEMLARVRFLGRGGDGAGTPGAGATRTGGGALFVPEALLLGRAGDRAAVFVVDEGASEADRREVTLGRAKRGGWVQVLTGVSPGDAVIDARKVDLSDGDHVNVVGEAEDTSWR